jgi:uncharacterized membrane protein YhaH (DUF805 family)
VELRRPPVTDPQSPLFTLGSVEFGGGVRMTIDKFLFSFQGRIDRTTWWTMMIGISILSAMVYFSLQFVIGVIPATLTVFPVYWITLVMNAKRLHDRGRSGWWQISTAVSLLIMKVGGLMLAMSRGDASLTVVAWSISMVGLLAACVALWIHIEIMFLAGQPGPNAFGGMPQSPLQLLGGDAAPEPMVAGAEPDWQMGRASAPPAAEAPSRMPRKAAASPAPEPGFGARGPARSAGTRAVAGAVRPAPGVQGFGRRATT